MRRGLLAALTLAVGATLAAEAEAVTTYSTCYQLPGRARDGTPVYSGMVASNYIAAGTRITILGADVRRFFGRNRFVVHDTGPALADGHLDIWAPGNCGAWGVRSISYRIGWPVLHGRKKPIRLRKGMRRKLGLEWQKVATR